MQNNQSLHFQSQYYQPLTPSTQDINSYVDEENLTFAVKMKRGLVENPTLCTEIDTINAPSATVDDDEIEEFDYKQDDSLFLPELIPLIQLKQSFENEDNLKFIMKMKKVLVEDPTSYTENDLHGITSTALDDEDIEEFDYKPDTFLFLQELNRSTHRHKNNHSRLNVFSPNQRGFIAGINGRSNNASIIFGTII
ncbi:hypothetical protein M9Y10_043167 [Tritrichomonas musculus]|uniref:Uncharacterized protein n=1 Tax=Tritrichomonas musculus TaxID=1915356 RepID=A0ABR2JYX7_9EUKA